MNKYLSFAISEYFKSPFVKPETTVSSLVVLILNGALALASIILLIILIGAGIAIIGSAGKGKPDDMAKATKTAASALIGFLIVFGAFLIVQFLGKFLGGDVNLITEPK